VGINVNYRVFIGMVLGVFVMFSPSQAVAGPLENLVMPGPVIEGHARIETQCTKCHSLFDKKTQKKLCLDCHKIVNKDIVGQKGFHGWKKDIAEKKCKLCHTEHEGRNADIIHLDEDTFDHQFTDFPLKGSHTSVKCYNCHDLQKKYRESPTDCYSCHKSDDPHFERLGKKCQNCHKETAWNKALFDHDKKTRFVLKGKHRDVKCNSCHPDERYKKTPLTCVGCHALNDVHRGDLGIKCEKCHNSKAWKKTSFNHDRNTKFPLKYSHAKLECSACHKGNPSKEKLKMTCISCHKNDDEHKGGFGPKCETCHDSRVWKKVRFNHDRDTKFKLVEKHAKLLCQNCHKGLPEKEKNKTRCHDCHRTDDAHKGQEGKKCDKCHHQQSWKTNVKFDHNKTGFPLMGLHVVTTCEQCHLSAEFKNVDSNCVDCHVKDDIHKKRLGAECGLCHSSDGWNLWKFDHTRQTEFILRGYHKELNCHLCHTRSVEQKIELSKTCYGCHKADDVHKGREGEKCDRCHNETAWGENIQFDHDLTKFPLIGIHAITTCEDCHSSMEFNAVKSDCINCHLKDDFHKKRMGSDCKLCHNPNHWNLWKFDHNTQSKFILDGAHAGLECKACHTEEIENKITLPKDCSECHQADNIHRGRFGHQCERCHITESFKKVILKRRGRLQ